MEPWSLAWDYTSTSGVEWDISAFCLHPENMGAGVSQQVSQTSQP